MPLESRITYPELADAAALADSDLIALFQANSLRKEDLSTVRAFFTAQLEKDLSGGLVSTGAAGAYVVASARAPATLTDGFKIAFRAHQDSAGADTLKVSTATAAKGLQTGTGAAIAALDLLAGAIYEATYVLAADRFRLASVGPKVQAAPGAVVAVAPQCRLVHVAAGQIRLDAFGGRQIPIPAGGVPILRTLPTAGALFDTGVTPTTAGTYYVYAYWSGSAVALELSATGWSADAATGLPIKTGDQTRLLVGLVSLPSNNTFSDTALYRGVLSYWNRRRRALFSPAIATADTTTSTAYVYPFTAPGLAFSTLAFADSAIELAANLQWSHNTAAGRIFLAFFDGSGVIEGFGMEESSAVNNAMGATLAISAHEAAEGLRAIQLRIKTNFGTVAVSGAASGSDRSSIRGAVWG